MMDMTNILMMATAIAAVTNGIVQAIKQSRLIANRFLPLVAIVVGLCLGASASFMDIDIVERIWAGVISGLAATGLFELSKNVNSHENK